MTINTEELKEVVQEAIENGDFEGAIALAENIAEIEGNQSEEAEN